MDEFANEARVAFRKDVGGRPVVELSVPSGTTLDVTRKLESLVYEQLAPEILRMGPCPNCRSGLDMFIRERFDDILRVDLGSMKVLR